jgi:hypothetical protein
MRFRFLSIRRSDPSEHESGSSFVTRLLSHFAQRLRPRVAWPERHPLGRARDDLAHHAAADALAAILAKVDHYAGRSRFTTSARKFVILKVSRKASAAACRLASGRRAR